MQIVLQKSKVSVAWCVLTAKTCSRLFWLKTSTPSSRATTTCPELEPQSSGKRIPTGRKTYLFYLKSYDYMFVTVNNTGQCKSCSEGLLIQWQQETMTCHYLGSGLGTIGDFCSSSCNTWVKLQVLCRNDKIKKQKENCYCIQI